jgi:Fur family ferric uptake transcriptional regulator
MYGHCIREDCPNRPETDDAEEPSPNGTTAKEAATHEVDE